MQFGNARNISALALDQSIPKDIEELLNDIPKFIQLIPSLKENDLSWFQRVVSTLIQKINDDNKEMIYELFGELLVRDLFFPCGILRDYFSCDSFRRVVSSKISNIFKISNRKEEIRVHVLNNILYHQYFTPKFTNSCYKITTLYFKEGPVKKYFKGDKMFAHLISRDNELRFEKHQDTIECQNAENLTDYFWNLYHFIQDNNPNIFTYENAELYLSANKRASISDGPVALLFAGGIKERTINYYPDELNCCLFAHHLREMGYSSDNILCFIEDYTFETSKIPLINEHIQVFLDTILCSHDSFKSRLHFKTITGTFNNAHVFAFSILKAVMDSKGPVLIYFSCHVDEYGLHFPFEPHDLSEDDFVELCCVLNTIGKHILFILDCYDSSRFVSRCNPSRFDFIHFITSSLNEEDSSGASLYTIPFCSNDERGNEKRIRLSSMFFRFFADSLYSIDEHTSLSSFVRCINHECHNVGFESRLFSNDETILVSLFIKSPLFRYFDYLHQSDNYTEYGIDNSNLTNTSYKLNNIKDGEIGRLSKDTSGNNIIEEDKEYNRIIEAVHLIIKEEKVEPPIEPTISLTNKQVKEIIDSTIKEFSGSYVKLRKLKKENPLPKVDNHYELYDWFKSQYKVHDVEALDYISYLIPLYCYFTERKDDIISFILEIIHNILK